MLHRILKRINWYFLTFATIGCAAVIILNSCDSGGGELVVGTSADNPPFEYSEVGMVKGFDIDLINAISEKLNKEIKIKNIDFEGLLPSLLSGHIDMAIAALSKTEERMKQIDFSRTYASTRVAVLTNKSDFDNIYQLKNDVIGAQIGTTWQEVAKDLRAKMPSISVTAMGDNLILLEELRTGRIDSIILEESQASSFQNKYPELTKLVLEDYSSNFAIAFKKDFAYRREINKIIKRLQADGTIKRLKQKWF
jgi:polar amino acid transport system substrate-binding protein